MKIPLKLYIPLGPDAELEITCVTRAYNRIASDPSVIRREPTAKEMFEALDVLQGRDALQRVLVRSNLDYLES